MKTYDTIVTREPIHKGWSGDAKYCVTTEDGNKYLLRITHPERAHRFYLCYQRMIEAAKLHVPMCLPVEFGQCPEGTYAIHSWIDGVDAESYIPTLSKEKQYTYGLEAGRILRKLHTLPAPEDAGSWRERYSTKIDRKIAMYEACPLKYDNFRIFIQTSNTCRSCCANCHTAYNYHLHNCLPPFTHLSLFIILPHFSLPEKYRQTFKGRSVTAPALL